MGGAQVHFSFFVVVSFYYKGSKLNSSWIVVSKVLPISFENIRTLIYELFKGFQLCLAGHHVGCFHGDPHK
jgi:hypothetical protein